jgi:hypothetical protein
MPHFDHDYVDDIVTRLEGLAPDTNPRWGQMTVPQLLGHLTMVTRYSMGKGPEMPDKSTWMNRTIVGPLLTRGIIPIPKNVKVPPPKGATVALKPEGDLETLQAVLEDYLHAVQSDDLSPPHHPFFGHLGVDGWARFHHQHFEHHLKQFGV